MWRRLTQAGVLCGVLAVSAGAAGGASWTLYRGDLWNRGAAPGPSQIHMLDLRPRWSYQADSLVSSPPTVAGGLVFTGTWSGDVVALDERSGAVRWMRSLGANPDTIYGGPRGVIGTVAIDRGVAYAVSGNCTAAAFRAADGQELWRRTICDVSRNDDTYASPVVFFDEVLFGIDQLGDRPTSRGFEIALDARTGTERWRFYPQRYNGTGTGISATPAIDADSGLAFFGTGNPTPIGKPPPGPDAYSESICALDVRSGKLVWAFGPVHPHDPLDRDLFASANIFDTTIHGVKRRLVGEAGKDDVYYAVDERTGALVWQRRLVPESQFAMVIGTPAVGFGAIYVPVFENQQKGWLVALHDSDGSVIWNKRLNGLYEAPLLWGDVLFVTEASGQIDAFTARDGKRLGRWPIERPALGRGPTVVGDTLYVASGKTLRSYTLVSD